MGKKRAANRTQHAQSLFARTTPRGRRTLILPTYLADEANKYTLQGPEQDAAHKVLIEWADQELQGHLKKKETALDAGFLIKVFAKALGFKTATDTPNHYHLERNFTVPGVGTADGAIGDFGPGRSNRAVAVIELKGSETDLDHDKFNGRTPVQQCWDYLNALPDCPWGIVSNFVSYRLFHRDKTPLAYQEFLLQDLRKIDAFRQFYCLFEYGAFFTSQIGQSPRAINLLNRTANRQREVGEQLYEAYSSNRFALIEHLHHKQGKSLEDAIHIAQKILDRIIFIAFCEDRGLLPEECLKKAYTTLPPFSKVTNPRWRNFLDLFHAVDKGHNNLVLEDGYNGGLFRHDDKVDDLQLDDDWTNFFHTIGTYDFRDEVNVDVLGHIFEKSVSELERIRVGGLFSEGNGNGHEPTMPKSPERKRFGIYYTPPEFTGRIVEETITTLIEERLEALRKKLRLTPDDLRADRPSAQAAKYWRAALEIVRAIKVCDPACGSGAFLVRAYDVFEEEYIEIVDQIGFCEGAAASDLTAAIPDMILADNLYGADVSEQAVEITQLALWLRTAQRGRTLSDLSKNIVWGNSLVTDPAVHPRAMRWPETFPVVFNRPESGFDCVIGNPPWERLKLQEREFFAFSAPTIAGAVSAATRRKLIAELKAANPDLHARYLSALNLADKTSDHVRKAGEFPLTAIGDINTYMLFAELAHKIVAPHGRVGLLVPSGIATDNTTRAFFDELVSKKALIALYDFENRLKVFPDVDGRFKFSVLLFAGKETKASQVDFVFFAHRMEDLKDKQRHIALSARDIALLNPNTRTCPIFRSRRAAELTKSIYKRVPVLIDRTREEGGNPWDIRFVRMFDQTNDAELFQEPAVLQRAGYRLEGNRWRKGKQVALPLYEAKMVQAYDHRAASVVIEAGNWVRQGQTQETTLVSHQNPEFVTQPRWWVDSKEVGRVRGETTSPAYLCFKDVTSPTNQRTVIAAFVPEVAVVNSAPLALTGEDISPRLQCCLLANLNSVALDFVARQKVGGLHLNFFIVEQFPIFPPDKYAERCPWDKKESLEKWVSDRVLKLTCTANDMIPLATAAGMKPPVHKWNPVERAALIAELDAAYFLLYGIARNDVEYILETFTGLRKTDQTMFEQAAAELILAAYDRLLT
jgi:hypothetical protein